MEPKRWKIVEKNMQRKAEIAKTNKGNLEISVLLIILSILNLKSFIPIFSKIYFTSKLFLSLFKFSSL